MSISPLKRPSTPVCVNFLNQLYPWFLTNTLVFLYCDVVSMRRISIVLPLRERASALLVVAVLALSLSIACSTRLETRSDALALEFGVVHVSADSENSWDGDCSGAASCSQNAPCKLPDSVVLSPSSTACTIVFAPGAYVNRSTITSSSALLLGFSGVSSSLDLTISAPQVDYASFPAGTTGATLSGSRHIIILSNATVSLGVTSMTFDESQIIGSNLQPITGQFDIHIADSTFLLQTNASGTFERAVFLVDVAANVSTGTGTFTMKNSVVRLDRETLQHMLLWSVLPFSKMEILDGSEVDSAGFVFNVPGATIKQVNIADSRFENLYTLVADPDAWEQAPYAGAKLTITNSLLNGTTQFYRDFAMLIPTKCMDLTVTNSTIAQMRLNCNDYSMQTVEVRCPARYIETTVIDSYFCVFGSPNSSTSAPTVFVNTTLRVTNQALNNPSQAPPLTWFRGPLEIEAQNLVIQNDAIVQHANVPANRPSIGGHFQFDGEITFIGESSMTANFLTLSQCIMRISRLTLHYALVLGSTATSMLLPSASPDASNAWNFVTPVSFDGGLYLIVDFSDVKLLNLVASSDIIAAYAAVDSRGNARLQASSTDLLRRIHVDWNASIVGSNPTGLPGQAAAAYNIGNFRFDIGATSITEHTLSMPGDAWNFTATTELVNDAGNVFNVWFGLATAYPPGIAPMYRGPGTCQGNKPYPGDFWCIDGAWVQRSPLNVTGNLWLPAASKTIIRGDLRVDGDIVFLDTASTLTIESGCLHSAPTAHGKPTRPSVVFQLDTTLPPTIGTRKHPEWSAIVIEQDASSDCVPHPVNALTMSVVDNRHSCMKVRATLDRAENPANEGYYLAVKFRADYSICNHTIIIVCCVVGAVFFVLVAALAVFCFCRRSKRAGYERLSPSKTINDSGMITSDESSALL